MVGSNILPENCAFIRRSGIEGLKALNLPCTDEAGAYGPCPYVSPTGRSCEAPEGVSSNELMGSALEPTTIACLALRERIELWPDPADRQALIFKIVEDDE